MIGFSGLRSRVVFAGSFMLGILNLISPFPVRPDSDYSSRSMRLGYSVGFHYNGALSIVNLYREALRFASSGRYLFP
jgi:hypothetical protein